MNMARFPVLPLRILLGLAFAFLLAWQLLILPAWSGHVASEEPDYAWLRWPVVSLGVLGIVCVQVVIVCTWKLLTMVRDDRIFSEDSLVWVDRIVWAIGAGWLLVLIGFLGLSDLGGPPLAILFMGMLLAGALVGLLILVMRALLRQATTLRTDMEAVI